ncbi:hypothetical protein Pyn_04125 [Prunus yedoensis var. nudiflora]|uniref:Cell division cycle protein 123 homolog n=1 Tax=Prunus yedoensis var. nudiflora TaxID=2094558 RepID=A0A314Y0V8_PRUYE|nr:hypothetical protein Pyn_04125 [Prunus yedoensis var. nudiflora]
MKEDEVNRCQIQEWYPKFKSWSIKTRIHELPEPFVQYLLDDSGPFSSLFQSQMKMLFPIEFIIQRRKMTINIRRVKESIESLGGSVFPKLNWSAPKDSAWISTIGTLKCSSFSEIALLLRSSDSLVHDLCHAYDSCHDKTSSRPKSFVLALRKWYQSLKPEMEFRCFVRNQNLVGISQREVTTFYPALLEKKDSLRVLIEDFFVENLMSRFESENYTFDVYVTEDDRVKVVDFNPWGAFTLPLMFTWEELDQNCSELGDDGVDVRIVEGQCVVRPGLKTAVPYDYLDTSPGSGWDQFMRNADEELQQQTRNAQAGA